METMDRCILTLVDGSQLVIDENGQIILEKSGTESWTKLWEYFGCKFHSMMDKPTPMIWRKVDGIKVCGYAELGPKTIGAWGGEWAKELDIKENPSPGLSIIYINDIYGCYFRFGVPIKKVEKWTDVGAKRLGELLRAIVENMLNPDQKIRVIEALREVFQF